MAGSLPSGNSRAFGCLGRLGRDPASHLRPAGGLDPRRFRSDRDDQVVQREGGCHTGFIVPAGPPDLSFFLLSRVSALGNYCCEAPVGQDETVYVFAAKEVNITYDPLRIFKIVGVFEAGMRADATYGPSLFRVRNARVEEALGAKVFKTGDFPASASKP